MGGTGAHGLVRGGRGVTTDPLFLKSLELYDKFFWESHGYTHLNFTETGKYHRHQTTYSEVWKEVSDNYVRAAEVGESTRLCSHLLGAGECGMSW